MDPNDQVEKLEDSGRWNEAAEYWMLVVAENRSVQTLLRCGRALAKAHRPEAAREALLAALGLDPAVPAVNFQLGLLLIEEHRLDEAVSFLQRGLAQEEVQPMLTVLGAAQRRLGRSSEAEKSLLRAIALDPEDSEAHFHLAMTLRESAPEKAIGLLRRTTELDPTMAAARRELGLLLWATGTGTDSYAEAEFHLRQAIRLNDEDAWAHHHLGLIFRHNERFEMGEQYLRRAAELMPSNELVLSDLAVLLRFTGRLDEARVTFERALALDPDNPIVLRESGLFEQAHGDPLAARGILERALRLAPDDRRVRAALERKH